MPLPLPLPRKYVFYGELRPIPCEALTGDCSICWKSFQSMEDLAAVTLPCNGSHTFCWADYLAWMDSDIENCNCCPTCRQPLWRHRNTTLILAEIFLRISEANGALIPGHLPANFFDEFHFDQVGMPIAWTPNSTEEQKLWTDLGAFAVIDERWSYDAMRTAYLIQEEKRHFRPEVGMNGYVRIEDIVFNTEYDLTRHNNLDLELEDQEPGDHICRVYREHQLMYRCWLRANRGEEIMISELLSELVELAKSEVQKRYDEASNGPSPPPWALSDELRVAIALGTAIWRRLIRHNRTSTRPIEPCYQTIS
jgi:hypothetical protein